MIKVKDVRGRNESTKGDAEERERKEGRRETKERRRNGRQEKEYNCVIQKTRITAKLREKGKRNQTKGDTGLNSKQCQQE